VCLVRDEPFQELIKNIYYFKIFILLIKNYLIFIFRHVTMAKKLRVDAKEHHARMRC